MTLTTTQAQCSTSRETNTRHPASPGASTRFHPLGHPQNPFVCHESSRAVSFTPPSRTVPLSPPSRTVPLSPPSRTVPLSPPSRTVPLTQWVTALSRVARRTIAWTTLARSDSAELPPQRRLPLAPRAQQQRRARGAWSNCSLGLHDRRKVCCSNPGPEATHSPFRTSCRLHRGPQWVPASLAVPRRPSRPSAYALEVSREEGVCRSYTVGSVG
jgi:hypothetical protein